MARDKKKHSLRLVGVLFIGGSVVLFAILIFGILGTSLPKMLQQAENRFLQNQMEVVEGVCSDNLDNVHRMTYDVAVGEEAVRYVRGEYPGLLEDRWPDGSLLDNYRFNFVYIKDKNGGDLHVEFYDYLGEGHLGGERIPEPEGFSEYLNGYAELVLREYSALGEGGDKKRELGLDGIMFYDGVPYMVGIMPVKPAPNAEESAGTVIMGNILSSEYLQEMTHLGTVDFAWIQDADMPGGGTTRNVVTTELALPDIDGNEIRLQMSGTRTIYLEGERIYIYTLLLLLVAVVAFGIAVYHIIVRLMILPVEALSRDIGNIEAEGALDVEAYAGNREFHTLAVSINAMLDRLNESNVSLVVLQSILDRQDSLVYVSDPADGTLLFMNENLRAQFALQGPAVGYHCWEVLREGLAERCANCPLGYLHDHPEEEVVWEEENAKAGRYYRNTDSLIRWTDGRLVHLHTGVDITHIKQAEAALQKRLEQQELMSAMSQTFISGEDTEHLIMRALQMAGEFMDMSNILLAHYDAAHAAVVFDYEWDNPREAGAKTRRRAENIVPGKPLYDWLLLEKRPFIAIDNTSEVVGSGFSCVEKGNVKAFIAVPLLRGEAVWGFLVFDECKQSRVWSPSDIQLVRMIGSVISGVIEQGEVEQQLLRLSSIIRSSPQYITFTDGSGVIEYVNPGATQITGYAREELVGQSVAMLFNEDNARYALREATPLILKEGEFEFEAPIVRRDGEKRVMLFSGFTVEGRDMGIGCIGTDVTAQRQMERDLVAAREKAEQSSRAKGDFLARMSHEMRTPLNAVIGMTSIARGTGEAERKEYCLDKIDEASTHLLGVVNDILDMSKIEAGKFELAYSEFDFEKMLVRVTGVMHFRVDEKDQDLVVHMDKGLPRYVYSDEQRLAQVITNLLGNAVKFTGEGGAIALNVRLLETEGDMHTLQVEVKDTGIGISPEQQSRLFRSFEQADGGISRRFGGTGLGLAISKNIVEAMGGEIWVESAIGEGSTFAFRLRVRQCAAPAGETAPAIQLSGVRALAVDDAPEIRGYFREISESLGFSCDVAQSGAEALALVEAAGENGYNIFFIDWRMPGMDGVELARRIRAACGDAVIILVSAAEWSAVEDEARQAGVDGFLAKPLFPSLLLDCINRYLAPESLQPPQSRGNCFAGRRVLLAEDVEINREIACAMLEDTGLAIESAENGVQALEMFEADPERYDLILMDIHMPEMDGYSATRALRALDHPRAGKIPIIAMTANVFREDVEKCLAAGMDDHIGKPINVEEMLDKLCKYLP